MGGLLTSKQTQRQQVDPTLAAESASLIGLLRMLMSEERPINRGVTIAGFTPSQEAAFSNQNKAAAAFGMQAPSGTGMPQTQTSASGIQGYSIAPDYDASQAALPASFRSMMEEFRQAAGTPTKEKKFSGGGKK